MGTRKILLDIMTYNKYNCNTSDCLTENDDEVEAYWNSSSFSQKAKPAQDSNKHNQSTSQRNATNDRNRSETLEEARNRLLGASVTSSRNNGQLNGQASYSNGE